MGRSQMESDALFGWVQSMAPLVIYITEESERVAYELNFFSLRYNIYYSCTESTFFQTKYKYLQIQSTYSI